MTKIAEKYADQIVELYKEGHSYDRIVDATGLSYYHVKQFIKNNRDKYHLERRKSFHAIARPLNSVAEGSSTWNYKLSREFIVKHWGQGAL